MVNSPQEEAVVSTLHVGGRASAGELGRGAKVAAKGPQVGPEPRWSGVSTTALNSPAGCCGLEPWGLRVWGGGAPTPHRLGLCTLPSLRIPSRRGAFKPVSLPVAMLTFRSETPVESTPSLLRLCLPSREIIKGQRKTGVETVAPWELDLAVPGARRGAADTGSDGGIRDCPSKGDRETSGSAPAAMTEDRLKGHLFLPVLEAGGPRSRCRQIRFLVRAHVLACRCRFLSVSSQGREGAGGCFRVCLLIKTLILSNQSSRLMTLVHLNFFLSPNTAALGVRASLHGSRGCDSSMAGEREGGRLFRCLRGVFGRGKCSPESPGESPFSDAQRASVSSSIR